MMPTTMAFSFANNHGNNITNNKDSSSKKGWTQQGEMMVSAKKDRGRKNNNGNGSKNNNDNGSKNNNGNGSKNNKDTSTRKKTAAKRMVMAVKAKMMPVPITMAEKTQ